MKDFNHIPDDSIIQKTIDALKENGMEAEVVASGEEAKEKVLSLIPEHAEVMNMTSITLDSIGLSEEIMESGKYIAIKKQLMAMDRETQAREMQKLGTAPEYAVGSAHAVTTDGHVFIASNTGSQLPAYVYAAGKVIWVIGAQKIVENDEQAKERVYDYVLPKESVRARKAYGLPDTFNSFVSKLLVVNREVVPQRIHIIFVKESLGF
ncbi:MAG TPA: LUD domain-containing protein [Patescibacteria group bacterium]|nr:LUD domain-containing protein [Patescibacteria group bacterium]